MMRSLLIVLCTITSMLFLSLVFNGVSTLADASSSTTGSSLEVIWYGGSAQDSVTPENDAVTHLQNSGVNVEKRARPLANLTDGKVVVIAAQYNNVFSSTEVDLLKNYVNDGGKLILVTDTDYFYCHPPPPDPPGTCAMEVSRNFGFGFDGDWGGGTIIPATGQSNHPIWKTPHALTSFSEWSSDARIPFILDKANVKVIGILTFDSVPLIVLNENPAYNGGKVLGTGYNMFLGMNGNWSMFDNIISFMLGRIIPFIAVNPNAIDFNENVQIELCAGSEPLHVLDAKITDPAGNSFFDVFADITILSNTCKLWNTNTDFPGLSTDIVGTYIVDVKTTNFSSSSKFGVPYGLSLFEGSSPSDMIADLNQGVTAVAETSNFIGFATFRWINPSGDPVRTEVVPLSVAGEKAVASDTFEPDAIGRWTVIADFGDEEEIVKTLDIRFNVIPESPLGALALIGSSLAALGGFVYFRQSRKNSYYWNATQK